MVHSIAPGKDSLVRTAIKGIVAAVGVVVSSFVYRHLCWKKGIESPAKNMPEFTEIYIWYASHGGTARRVAVQLAEKMKENFRSYFVSKLSEDYTPPECKVLSIENFDVESMTGSSVLIAPNTKSQNGCTNSACTCQESSSNARTDPNATPRCSEHDSTYEVHSLRSKSRVTFNIFVVSTYENGEAPPTGKLFYEVLTDATRDFRLPANAWNSTYFAVFGCGSRVYGNNYNAFAKKAFSMLPKKGALPLLSAPFLSDETSTDEDALQFLRGIMNALGISQPVVGKSDSSLLDVNSPVDAETEDSDDNEEYEERKSSELDIEDMVGEKETSEMINPRIRAGLTKQGYSLFGTHSGVKLCRWTKSMLRGRGGCYKHTFYGISSLSCMEMTPSLACANKCVFCWRHHTNPTAREWKWKHDKPSFLLDSALQNHRRMIKILKGAPGVTPERMQQAMKIRHCALSLVGEPIIYPEINTLVQMMHENGISTFMVTNAQFPDCIERLTPVTQLYVSVDAGNKTSLKKIDRPIFEDFWERFLSSLKILADKKQRTVYRLTLVKQYNTQELGDYASLVAVGRPDFIEVKGVTYCGDSGAGGVSMANVPYHEEVIEFCKLLQEKIGQNYLIACEHEHSCCVLLAKREYLIEGVWHTWIDYDKFYNLALGSEPFTSMDYAAPTPTWAVYGASEKGFDPLEVRHRRKKKVLE